MPPRDFPPGNFWQVVGKNEARKRGKKMGNVGGKWKKEMKIRKNWKN